MTRVSESARSPWASATCSESEAPTERRSDTRCSTATLDTPKARESFHDDWSHRATPRFDKMAQASSTTRKTCPLVLTVAPRADDEARAKAACSHAVAQAMRMPRAAEV